MNASNALSRKIQLVTLDNANNRQRATENTQLLIGQHAAMVLFGYNSATDSLDSLPLVAQNNMLFFAPFSRSTKLRGRPNVYTLRASYKEEAGIAKTSGVAVKRGAKLEQASIDALTKDGPHYVLATTQYSVVGD